MVAFTRGGCLGPSNRVAIDQPLPDGGLQTGTEHGVNMMHGAWGEFLFQCDIQSVNLGAV